MVYFMAVLCVLGIATGQLLFKVGANYLHESGTFFCFRVAVVLFFAFSLYGVTTIGWVWVLQKVDLGKVYPLMALAFVFVPVGSYFLFGERFHIHYFFGVVLILIGIMVTIRS